MAIPDKLPSSSPLKGLLTSAFSNGIDYDDLINIAKNAILTNRFISRFAYPSLLSSDLGKIITPLELSDSIKSVNLPSYNLETDSYTRGMFERYVGTKRSLGDLSVTFYENNTYSVRRFFQKWINGCFIIDVESENNTDTFGNSIDNSSAVVSVSRRYVDEYTGTFIFHPLDNTNTYDGNDNRIKIEYQVFPYQISEASYDSSSDNTIGEITVAFKCKLAIGKF